MTQTASLHLTEPTVGGDSGTWAGLLNTNMVLIDRGTNGVVTVAIPDTNVTLVADGTVSDQSIYAVYWFTGALTANRTVTLPSNVKIGMAANNTTGGHNVILSAGGTTSSISPGGAWSQFYCDGSNVTRPNLDFGGTLSVATAGTSGNLVTNFSQFNPSLSANGYTRLPGSFLVQWGTATITSGGPSTISFPTTFTSQVWSVQLTKKAASAGTPPSFGVGTVTLTTFDAYTNAGVTSDAYFLAVGQ